MNKLKCFLFILLTIFMISCKDINVNKIEKDVNFDKVLKDCNFTYDSGYFITADYGCIFNPKGENNFGNMIVYLIPKKQIIITDENIENENKRVNNLSIENYKNEFNIYVYLTESQYLNYNKNGDPIYYHKASYTEKLYTYEQKNNWLLLDSLNILNSKSNEKEQEWRDGFITKLITISNKENTVETTNNISEKWLGTYHLTINENSKDWRDTQELKLEISKNSIKYSVEGYQIDQRYILTGLNLNNNLKLKFHSALENTESGVLEKTKDFGEISFDDKNYNWVCPYNDISFMDGKKQIYILKKMQN